MNSASHGLTLQIWNQGKLWRTIPLVQDGRYSIGRGQDNQICLDDPSISRVHLELILNSNTVQVVDFSSYGSRLNSAPLVKGQVYSLSAGQPLQLSDHIVLKFSTPEYQDQTEVATQMGVDAPITGRTTQLDILARLRATGNFSIGRSANCDLTIDSLQVSRRHALLYINGDSIILEDQDTTNGTFVNGELIKGRVVVTEDDEISIGSHLIRLVGKALSKPLAITAKSIEKVYPRGNVGLHRMDLNISRDEFVALMGPSGCGKSTLLKCLNGANPVTAGEIRIQGLKLNNENFNMLKKHIGYVPQDDIVHRELTVKQTLYYAAKLRMSADVSNREIHEKIAQVLTSLNLPEVADILPKRISELSGGQRKRISIAVELMNDPTILFLDEPTSPLDPETIDEFLNCIRGLAQAGQTVIMVTHKPSDLEKVDKVIFLSKGGYQTYYGDKSELSEYFQVGSINEIYSLLKDEQEGSRWNRKLTEDSRSKPPVDQEVEVLTARSDTSLLRQLYWLSRRYLNIKWNDHFNLLLLMAQPVIIALLLLFIFAELQLSVFFMMAVSAVWFGVSNASKEIVSELAIYERERMYNLNIFVYILSKVLVLSFIAFIQVFFFVGLVYLYYTLEPLGGGGDVEIWTMSGNVLFMFCLSVSSTIFGLLLSSLFTSSEKVMTIVPIALMPQIMLAGVIAPVNSDFKVLLSYFTLGRWGTEGFAHIQDNAAKSAGKFVDSAETMPASVMQLSPAGPQAPSEMVMRPHGAIDQLGIYDKNEQLVSLFPQSLVGVSIAIALLSVVFFVGIYFALKNKDSRFI